MFDGTYIEIPIFDVYGHHIFSKYRKNPFSNDDSPKYKYEPGSTSTLYNAHTVVGLKNQTIFITEGELDALVLNSFGFLAVSSTGGCSTFKIEWAEMLKDNDVYIVYDKDDAGIRGSLKVNKMIPHAKIVYFPENFRGKDITDFFRSHTVAEFLKCVDKAETWTLPYDPYQKPITKKEVDVIMNELKLESSLLLERKRRRNETNEPTAQIDILLEMINNRLDYWKKYKMSLTRKANIDMSDIEKARSVPIYRYVRFNNSGFAPCLWHSEKTPSMKYYPDRNKVYCFGCNAHKDVIDVVMQKDVVDFNRAIKLILGEPLQ